MTDSSNPPKKAYVFALLGFLLINLSVLSYVFEWNKLLINIPLPLGILALIPAWLALK